MCARCFLVREKDADTLSDHYFLRIIRIQQQTNIVSVHEGNIAYTGNDSLRLVTIVSFWSTCQVLNQTFGPFLRFRFAVQFYEGRQQRLVIQARRGSDQYFTFPGRANQVLIG
ncbi:hypothetical protein D3C72_2074790 [compost metagenome]